MHAHSITCKLVLDKARARLGKGDKTRPREWYRIWGPQILSTYGAQSLLVASRSIIFVGQLYSSQTLQLSTLLVSLCEVLVSSKDYIYSTCIFFHLEYKTCLTLFILLGEHANKQVL